MSLNTRSIVVVLIIALAASTTANAQKRKRPASRTRASKSQQPAAPVTRPRIIGSSVLIITRNGDRISGEVLDLTAYSIRIRSNNLESTISLDTIASLSFGGAAAPSRALDQPLAPVRSDFSKDADAALGFFQSLASTLKPGVDYAEYVRQLTELRRATERLVAKYGVTDNPAEARVISLLSAALTDYSWARTLWTLKFGRSSDGTLAASDSPVVSDVLALYPDLNQGSAGVRLSAEKLIAGVWRKASEKSERARSLLAPSR